MNIVIAVNKNDFWFCRICVASIRFYYPDIRIYLLKDELNGKFSTTEIENNFQVEIIEYPIKKFGWSASKMHFYADTRFKNENFLVLDSDIVFIGKILEQDYLKDFICDIVVSHEMIKDPKVNWFKNIYFDYDLILNFDPEFQFSGYSFNCGQLFCKGGFLDPKIVEAFFDFHNYPPWKRLDIFPLVDQSLFNYLLPKLEASGQFKIEKRDYMVWSESKKENLPLKDVIKGNRFPNLIHWAGARRTPYLKKMSHSEILIFFENEYYKKIKLGYIKKYSRRLSFYIRRFIKRVYFKLKRILFRKCII